MHGWENLKDEDLNLILRGIRDGRAYGGPFHAEIDPIDLCNVACFFCGSAALHQGGVLRWDRLGGLVEELIAGGLRSFRLSGGGEPLIYPDLAPLIDRMAAEDIALDNLTTNGIRLHAHLDDLMKLRIGHVLVSLNYSNGPQYERFMRTPADKFDMAVKNIHRLDEALRAAGRRDTTKIFTQFFVHRSTVDDIPEMMDLGLSLPIDHFTLKSIGYIPEEEVILEEQKPRILEHLRAQVPRAAGGAWLELDFGLTGIQAECAAMLADMRGTTDAPASPPHDIEYCLIPWYSMTIQGSGDAHACCYLMQHPGIPPLGNVRERSIRDVWHGEMYQRFRYEMRTVMLMQEQVPLQHRLFQCTTPECWAHDQCPLAFMMAERPYYERVHGMLEQLRRRPMTRAGRGANRASRRAINALRALRAGAR